MHDSLSEEESCLSITYASYTGSSSEEDSDVDKEASVQENAAHVYSELTVIRDKLHVRNAHTLKKQTENDSLSLERVGEA